MNIEHSEYIELLRQMIATPSVSREEAAVADLLAGWMAARGLEVHRTLNNLWVESEPVSDKPTLLLNGHIDTVRPASGYARDPYDAAVEGDVLHGLGSNDDGGCVVALLETYVRLTQHPQPYRLVFSATAEEEITGECGIDAVMDQFGPVALGIIGEPTGMRMAVAEKGLLVLDCTAFGKSGHAARGEGVNAIYEALKDIEWFRNFQFERKSDHLGAVKMTVTVIQAGTQHNVVPDLCKFVVDVRPNGEYTNSEIVDIIRSHVSCDVAPRSLRHNSSSIPAGHPVVRRGAALGLEQFGSPTTSNQTRCGFPTLKIGPGESSRSHSADEYILLSEISRGADIYYELLNGLEL